MLNKVLKKNGNYSEKKNLLPEYEFLMTFKQYSSSSWMEVKEREQCLGDRSPETGDFEVTWEPNVCAEIRENKTL